MNKNKKAAGKFVSVTLIALTAVFFAGVVFASQPRIERMSFIEAPVGHILQSLGRMYGVNFSISSGAAAKKVSIELNNLSFEDALHMIASAAGVSVKDSDRGLYIVRSIEEENGLVSETEKESARKEDKLTTSLVEVVSVKYVSVKDIEDTIKKTFVDEGDSLVKISKVATDDKRSYNNLVVTATNKRLMDAVKKIIAIIDKPKPMVEIEVLFVELIRSNNSDTGIDWNLAAAPFEWSEGGAPSGGDGGDDGDSGGTATAGGTASFDPFRFGTFYRLTPWQAKATLTALKGNSKSRVLADPKIRVMSGRKAVFSSETQVPILSRNSDGDVNTEWKNVGINLEILPVVLDDGSVHLQAVPRASSITGEKKLGDVVAPVISERKAETEVLMHPGETMVIGGLMNDKEVRTMSKVPLLSDIPLLGALFKSERKENEKSTVVIFLRPHLVKDTMATMDAYSDSVKGEWEAQSKKAVEVFELPAQTEPGKRPVVKNELSLDERIELLRKEVEASDKKKAEIEASLSKEKNKAEFKATPAVKPDTAPQTKIETKKAPDTKKPSEPVKPKEVPSGKTEKKAEKLPAAKPAQEAAATEKPAPAATPENEPKWKQVGDVDDYLKGLLEEYSAKRSGEENKTEQQPVQPEPQKVSPAKPMPVPSAETQVKKEEPKPKQDEAPKKDPGEWVPPME